MESIIRWGILGTGLAGRDFAEGLRYLPDAQLLAVCSRTGTNAEAFAQQFGVPHWYQSHEELVKDRDIDVVYVATPNFMHKEHCLISLQAGKAVLCEKPFTRDAAEARQVIDLARDRGLFCMEAMWMRFLPAMARLRTMLENGTLGEVRMLMADLGFPMPYNPQNRVFNPAMGGGALLDLGI